ncbi:substrate-binding domain-containing protein [Inquilinus sp. Marseille-Q2685]|uniref:substrate-binding domain-containing protein n=1 Tax=Inquilinus sp. Marseille-Q2685 TaxID=2866581 RepID=UPI001CE407BA|nr:substrate-binding domain-containing protein [Inquilinus sp. Marseille-Q2685]
MSSAFPRLLLAAVLALAAGGAGARELRVCADPNNLPFSNEKEEGFENRIAALVAQDLGATVTYTWWAQRRGFIRETLQAGLCDLVPGTMLGLEMLRSTRPYYRSGYVFVTRADGPQIRSFDDPALKDLRIGVQLVGDDGANPPPAEALARRGLAGHVVGYTVYGNYAEPSPAGRIVAAVAKGEIDVAVVWGPFAGYFAPRQRVGLTVTPVQPQTEGLMPMVFDIAMGVRREDKGLADEVNAALSRHRGEIDAILARYGVPRLDLAQHVGP